MSNTEWFMFGFVFYIHLYFIFSYFKDVINMLVNNGKSVNNVNSLAIEYKDKNSLFTYAELKLEDDIIQFDLFKHENDKQPSKTLKFNFEYFSHEFKNGYCQHCMFKFGEILPQKIIEIYNDISVFNVYIHKVCPHNHVIG